MNARTGTRRGKRYLFQALFLVAGFAVILGVRGFVLEGYFIPTPSMEPTFMGDPESGDKVIVDKTRFLWDDPSRWMIAVFSRQNKPGAYIKRIVGLPGDDLRISMGDVFNHREILRKPLDRLEALLIPVYTSAKDFCRFSEVWRLEKGTGALKAEGLNLLPGEKGDLILQTDREVTDGYLDRQGVFCHGSHPVGDLEVALVFNPSPGLAGVEIGIQDGWDKIRVCFESHGPARVFLPREEPFALDGMPLKSSGPQFLTVSNIDDRLLIKVAGKCGFGRAYISENRVRGVRSDFRRNMVEVVFRGGGALLKSLTLKRDLFYTPSGNLATRESFRVQKDSYFLLGDNSANSSDSRQWGLVPRKCMIGTPVAILWPLERFRLF